MFIFSKKDRRSLRRTQECLLGVQVGDALGMPVEIMTPEEILKATDGQGVQGFIEPIQRRIHDTMDLNAGDSTDDWQLTAAVARSLIRMNDYDQRDMAAEHIAEFRRSKFGWGGTTTKGIQSLIEGRDPWDPPPALGPGKGCGNGVAMKIAPFGLYSALRQHEFDRVPSGLIKLHGRLTHPDERAAYAAHALATAIAKVLHKPLARENAIKFLRHLATDVFYAEERIDGSHYSTDTVFGRLQKIDRYLHDPIVLRENVGTGCLALESVPFAIGTFLRHPNNFEAGVLEAVNAGGDTDTNASMVGALIGANGGRVPHRWKQGLPDKGAEAMRLGKALFKAALKKRK